MGTTPLFIASQEGHTGIVKLCWRGTLMGRVPLLPLFGSRADINKDYNGVTPLCAAAGAGHQDVVQLLVSKGASMKIANKQGETPLCVAVRKGRVHVIELLLRYVDTEYELFMALKNDHAQVIKVLMEAGPDQCGASFAFKQTLLESAIRNSHTQVIEFLLQAGADKEGTRTGGKGALLVAAEKGNFEAVDLLLNAGAEKDATDKDGRQHCLWQRAMVT